LPHFALWVGTSEIAAAGGNAKGYMRRLILAVVVGSVLVGLGFYVNRRKAEPATLAEPEAQVVSAAASEEPRAVEPVAARIEQPARLKETQSTVKAASRSIGPTGNSGLDAANLSQTLDLLVSKQASYQQKRDAWKQLREAGKLDPVIAELEHRTANDPRAAEYPAALGQGYLQKCAVIEDMREKGILAMQADKAFETALNLDPSNWEARFTKAVAMSYWPPALNKGEEVIEQFQTLIEQQETQAPEPQFASSYAWLGEQYQKAGRTNDAVTVWQRGAALFPADELLRKKVASTEAVKEVK